MVAVGVRPAPELTTVGAADERDLRLRASLVYLDPPKKDAAQAVTRLAELGMRVCVLTGDHPQVAAKVCRDIGLPDGGTLTGADVDRLDDTALAAAVDSTIVFAA